MHKFWQRERVEALALREESALRLRLSVVPAKRFFAVEEVEEVPLPRPVPSWNSEEKMEETGVFLGERFHRLSSSAVVAIPFGLTDFTTERHDQDSMPEADNFRSAETFYTPSLKAFVRAQCVERHIELLFRPLVERCGLSVLEPVELGVCRAMSFAMPEDSTPQFHIITWSTSVLFAFMIRGEPLCLRSLHWPTGDEQGWLIREFKRTTDYVTQLFPELGAWAFFVAGARAQKTLAILGSQQSSSVKVRLLKVEDCWDAELAGFAADHWLDAIGLALRP